MTEFEYDSESRGDDHPLVEIARKMRYQLTALQGQVSEMLRQLDELRLAPPTRLKCETCDATARSVVELEEHIYRHHDGPLPEHYRLADLRAGDTEPVG